jgi:hypothetical protein
MLLDGFVDQEYVSFWQMKKSVRPYYLLCKNIGISPLN